jgi:hypothetical protein
MLFWLYPNVRLAAISLRSLKALRAWDHAYTGSLDQRITFHSPACTGRRHHFLAPNMAVQGFTRAPMIGRIISHHRVTEKLGGGGTKVGGKSNTNYSYDPVSRLLWVLHKVGTTTKDGAT